MFKLMLLNIALFLWHGDYTKYHGIFSGTSLSGQQYLSSIFILLFCANFLYFNANYLPYIQDYYCLDEHIEFIDGETGDPLPPSSSPFSAELDHFFLFQFLFPVKFLSPSWLKYFPYFIQLNSSIRSTILRI